MGVRTAVLGGHLEDTSTLTLTQVWACGRPYVQERLLGLTYQVSPSAFFQVNTEDDTKDDTLMTP